MTIRQPAFTLADVEREQVSADKRTQPKEFIVERTAAGLYFIRFSAGGEVPDTLKGFFTTGARADQAIASHKERMAHAAASR